MVRSFCIPGEARLRWSHASLCEPTCPCVDSECQRKRSQMFHSPNQLAVSSNLSAPSSQSRPTVCVCGALQVTAASFPTQVYQKGLRWGQPQPGWPVRQMSQNWFKGKSIYMKPWFTHVHTQNYGSPDRSWFTHHDRPWFTPLSCRCSFQPILSDSVYQIHLQLFGLLNRSLQPAA